MVFHNVTYTMKDDAFMGTSFFDIRVGVGSKHGILSYSAKKKFQLFLYILVCLNDEFP